MESKSEKFKRIAENRTNRIIDQIRVLGNLSNTSNYEFTMDEVDQIFKSIQTELKKTREMFELENEKKFRLKWVELIFYLLLPPFYYWRF